jgi:hypothetical protein
MPVLVSDNVRSRTILMLGGVAGALLAAAAALWAYYGTAVFFEMVRIGWTACF